MQENAVVIASKEREAVLYLAEDAPRAVRIACTNFLTDLNKICGCPARMTHDAREANVLVGVIGEDAALRRVAVVLFCRRPREKAAVRSLPTVRSSSGYGRCCPRWRSPRATTFSPSPQSDRGCGSTASILPREGSSRPTTGIFRQASARREDAPARRGTPCRL